MSREYRTIRAADVLGKFSAERRAAIAAGAKEIIAEDIALSELRKAKRITQEQIAKKIGGKQVYISRFERRSDVKLSKLYKYVNALGGTLELLVTFPDDKAYALKGFAPRRTNARAATRKKK